MEEEKNLSSKKCRKYFQGKKSHYIMQRYTCTLLLPYITLNNINFTSVVQIEPNKCHYQHNFTTQRQKL